MVRAARDARAALTVLAILAVVVGAPLLYQGYREQSDWVVIAGYVLAGVGVFGLGALYLYGSGARRVARWCVGGVLLVAVADLAENLALLGGLTGAAGQPGAASSEVATPLAVLKFAIGGPLLPVFVVVGSVLLGRRLHGPSRVRRREDGNLPEIARASELDPGTDRRPDIILPPAVADSSTATLSATVGASGPDVQAELYTEAGRDRAAEVAATDDAHPDPTPTCPARRRPAGATPAGCRRGGRPPRSASAPRAAGSARPRSPWGRSRRSGARSCCGPATWCRCPAAAT